MNAPVMPIDVARRWGDAPTSRAPGWVYTDPALYREELERFFYRGHWCYVGLECEVPDKGDFKRTAIGERSVIMVRDDGGEIRVVENRCAHRGVAFCRERHGRVRSFTCPYHLWTYKLNGELKSLPFRHGVRQDGQVNGGMPEDFEPAQHGLTALKVARRGGAVFASFDPGVEPFEDFVGAEVLEWFDRVFSIERPLRVLGVNRQRIPANWKLMQENIKDPYHPGLLHTWFVTFGLWRADQRSRMVLDARGRHAAMISRRGDTPAAATASVTQGVASFRAGMTLHDDRLLDVVPEAWWGVPTVVMTTLFPSVIIQQQVNSLSTRQIIPTGAGRVRLRLDALRLRRRQRRDDTPAAAPGEPVRPGRFRVRRRRRSHRDGAAGLRRERRRAHLQRTRRTRGQGHRAHGHRDADPRHVRLLARGDGAVNGCSADEWLAINALYADYAAALDARELERWPDFFTEDCVYKLQSRENFDRGWPLATLAFESRGMLKDRVYAAKDTLFHDPYHQRHIVGMPRVLETSASGWRCEAALLVVRTPRDRMPEIVFVGRTLDHVVHTPAGLRLAERLCIFDNDLLPNSVVDPI